MKYGKFTFPAIIILELALLQAWAWQQPPVFLAVDAEVERAAHTMPSLSQTAAAVQGAATVEVALPPVAGEVASTSLLQQIQFTAMGTLTAYVGTACLTAGAIVALYWEKGWLVILRIITYLLALSTMKLSVKLIYVDYNFNYPKFVTASHFFSCAIVAFTILQCRRSDAVDAVVLENTKPSTNVVSAAVRRRFAVPTSSEFWLMVVPISMGFAVSVAANNMALLFSSAAFTEIVASTSPVVSIVLIVCLGMPFDMRLLWPTLLVVAGCAISTSGEVNFSSLGMLCCMISILGRAFKTTMQQRVLTGESKDKFDPVALLAWMCVPSALMMGMWSFCVEGFAPFAMIMESSRRRALLFSLSISCVNACILNLSNLFCVKDLGAIGVQLVAQMKSVLSVLGAVALFHEVVTPVEIIGFVGVLMGVFLFSHMEKAIKSEKSQSPPSSFSTIFSRKGERFTSF